MADRASRDLSAAVGTTPHYPSENRAEPALGDRIYSGGRPSKPIGVEVFAGLAELRERILQIVGEQRRAEQV